MTQRLVLFIDAQNFYNDARRAFFDRDDHFTYGNFDPIKLAQLICHRLRPGMCEPRSLHQVRIYTARPDASKEPKGYGAHLKQCTVWQNAGVIVVSRTLRYPPPWDVYQKPLQKGVDVALAVDFVALAIDDEYDIGIIASTDTDLRPALEFVLRKFPNEREVEVASWWSEKRKVNLTVPGVFIWCHRLYHQDYDAVADLTNYTR